MGYTNIDFNNKSILITGGAGFIGSNLAFYFQNNFPNAKVTIFDCFRNGEALSNGNLKSFGHYKNLIGFRGKVICGDLTNKKDIELLGVFNFDFIFHQAAISDTRINDQELVLRTNVNSFYDILKITKKCRATLVYASSAALYGNRMSPQTVGMELPINPYGYSKYAMDQMAQGFIQSNPELTIVGLRYFNVYGPREFYKNITASMVIQLGHQILAGNAPRLFEESDKIKRDFIYIEDVVQGNIKACSTKKSGIYNIGTGKSRSFLDIVKILQKCLDTNLKIEYFINPHDGYQIHTQADISSSMENLGFKPFYELEDGIEAYIPEIKRLYKEKHND